MISSSRLWVMTSVRYVGLVGWWDPEVDRHSHHCRQAYAQPGGGRPLSVDDCEWDGKPCRGRQI